MNGFMKIRTLVVDDEPPARSRLKRLLAGLPDNEWVGEAGSATQALVMIETQKPDLVLLDISMPGLDGIGLAALLQDMKDAPAVVFCTAYPDRALDAFERDAIDYLVKPVRKERLKTALSKAQRYLAPRAEADSAKEYLRATVGGKTLLIDLDEVICLVAEDKYTTVHYQRGKTVINDSLIELERRYPHQLLRVHRNALVAPGFIRGLQKVSSGSVLLMLEGTDFQPEVSRRKLSAIRRLIKQGF